jgi:hypothetical protein
MIPVFPKPDVIPPITDPMGKHWRQPPRDSITLDETHALMSRATFEQLAEYSGTFPTGVYEGKMWKRHDGLFDQAFRARGGKPEWLLVWFGYCDEPKMVSNNFRKILIVEEGAQ